MTSHVLCAVDLEHDETGLLKTAADLATHYGATLSVVTVIPDYGMSVVSGYFEPGTMKKAAEEASTRLHAFVDKTLPGHGHVQHLVEVGNIYRMVLDAAERAGADLIVIGSHKPDLVDRLTGPNAEKVVRHADCSVLVVRR